MYTSDKFARLTSKYGGYASWAIWDYQTQSDPSVINECSDELHSKFVLLALNISGTLNDQQWANFHYGPSNIRKLKYACNNTLLRGSYITDLFKGIPEKQSMMFKTLLTEKIIYENVDFFRKEMSDIGLDASSKFIVFGTPSSLIAQYFNQYFKGEFHNQVIYHYHYSYYGISDKEWVMGLWRKLGINQSFELTVSSYK